jgi:hypothetical protein
VFKTGHPGRMPSDSVQSSGNRLSPGSRDRLRCFTTVSTTVPKE